MRRLFIPLLLGLACAVVALACTNAGASPNPRLTVSGGGASAPDSTVLLSTRVYVRNKVAGDTLRFDYRRNDTLLVSHRKPWADTDSLLTAAPAYGQTAKYGGCAQIERGGRTSGKVYPSQPVCWSWSYTRPAPPIPDPVIDSIKQVVVRPAQATALTVLAGASPASVNRIQFCAFGVTTSGRRVKMRNSWNIPGCESAYQSWLAERST